MAASAGGDGLPIPAPPAPGTPPGVASGDGGDRLRPATSDLPLRAALQGRRGMPYSEALAVSCYAHGVRLGRCGEEIASWWATAPRWARYAVATGRSWSRAMARDVASRRSTSATPT